MTTIALTVVFINICYMAFCVIGAARASKRLKQMDEIIKLHSEAERNVRHQMSVGNYTLALKWIERAKELHRQGMSL